MKRFFSIILLIILLISMQCQVAFATSYVPPFEVSGKSIFMANLDSNMVIYDKDATKKIDAGAMSQLMTVLMAFENIENPKDVNITMKGYIQDDMNSAYNKYGSIRLGGIYKGETLTAENLINAVTLQNACEAAYMLADYISDGSVDYFVKMMNVRAKELGMNNTNFTNPTGLPDENAYTTAYDVYLLGRHAMEIPAFMELIPQSSHNGGPTNRQESLMWTTTNKFLQKSSDFYTPWILCLKSGDNPETGESSAVALAKKNGYTYMISLLNASSPTNEKASNRAEVFSEAQKLFQWSFDTFRVKTLLEEGKSFNEIPLRLCGGKDYLRLMSAHNFSALIPDEIEASSVKYELKLPDHVDAPVKKGDVIGEVELVLANKPIGRVAVISAEDAKASQTLIVLNNFSNIIGSFRFKFAVCFALVSAVSYVLYTVFKNRNRHRYKKER